MKINISQMSYDEDDEILIDDVVIFDKNIFNDTEIRALSEVQVKGKISLEEDSTYSILLNVKGEMILPCSISLKDVKYPFDIEIVENIDPNDAESEDYLRIIDNSIDIMPIIWQNIVVEIPMKVVSPDLVDVKLEGDGWKLLTEEEKMKELDPRLDKLRDLLDD
ncbi:MAG: YceD family protein [Bacilli bacterium]|nr:YceD family protein [Bacilli bacterium]